MTATVQGGPDVILECADCHDTGPILGTRFVHPDLPHDPLCAEDFIIAARVWHGTAEEHHLHLLGPKSHTDDGTLWVRRRCPRCGGKGTIPPYRGTCFGCWGYRWTYVNPAGVQRTARWSATFQANRTPG